MAIESVANQFQTAFATQSQQGADAAKGSFLGRAVAQAATPESLLADAAEELAFSVDTTDDFELEERKERDKATQAQADRVRMYQELMHEAGKGEQIGSLRDSIRSRADARAALDKAREYFPDPSDAWAALQEIAEELRNSGDAEQLKAVQEALDQLEQAEGPAIRSGIQGALAARGFPELGSADGMRDLYRQTVCEFGSVMDVFSHVQKEYGGDFDRAMDFLFSALSADIDADVPSMGTRHLESVHDTLGKVRLTQSAYRLCEDTVSRWENVHGMKQGPGGLTAMTLLGEVIGLGEKKFLSGLLVEGIMRKSGARDPEQEVLFLQELINTARKFPSALFGDDAGRLKVISAMQDAVDSAVTREDEWLAQMDG